MATYHFFARDDYALPLAHTATVEADSPPTLETLPIDRDPAWIELVVIPDAQIHWVIRDGRLITREEVAA